MYKSVCAPGHQQPCRSQPALIGPGQRPQKPALAPTFAYRHCSHAPLAPKIAAPSSIGRELFSMQTLVEQIVYISDMFGTAVFAFSGVLVAGRLRMDGFGVMVLAAVHCHRWWHHTRHDPGRHPGILGTRPPLHLGHHGHGPHRHVDGRVAPPHALVCAAGGRCLRAGALYA